MKNLILFFLITLVNQLSGPTTQFDKENLMPVFDLPTVHVIAFKNFDSDLAYIARTINSESKSEPLAGKIAVGNVIVNRKDRRPYKTFKEVVERKGQFDGVRTKYYREYPSQQSINAAYIALNKIIENVPQNTYYFANISISTDRGWINKLLRDFNKKDIGRHSFFHKV